MLQIDKFFNVIHTNSKHFLFFFFFFNNFILAFNTINFFKFNMIKLKHLLNLLEIFDKKSFFSYKIPRKINNFKLIKSNFTWKSLLNFTFSLNYVTQPNLHLYFLNYTNSLSYNKYRILGANSPFIFKQHNVFEFTNIDLINKKLRIKRITKHFNIKTKKIIQFINEKLSFHHLKQIKTKQKQINTKTRFIPILSKINQFLLQDELFRYVKKILFLDKQMVSQNELFLWFWKSYSQTAHNSIKIHNKMPNQYLFFNLMPLFTPSPINSIFISQIDVDSFFFFLFANKFYNIEFYSNTYTYLFAPMNKLKNHNNFKKIYNRFHCKLFEFNWFFEKKCFKTTYYLRTPSLLSNKLNQFVLKKQIFPISSPSFISTRKFFLKIPKFVSYNNKILQSSQTWKPSIISAFSLPFISSNHAFLITTFPYTNHTSPTEITPIIKRKLYSFIEPNELSQFIINRHSNQTFNVIINGNLPSFAKTLSTNFVNHFTPKTLLLDLFNTNLTNNQLSFFIAPDWGTLNDLIFFNEFDDFVIKQIKFKPGYMRIWRTARSVLANLINLHHKYQYRITRYLFKFNYLVRLPIYMFQEFQLQTILLSSQMLLSKELVVSFIKNGNIFVNGFINLNPEFQLYLSDFVQCLVHIKYYITFRILFNYSYHFRLKFKQKIKRKLNARNRDFDPNIPKMSSHYLPSWIKFYKHEIQDIPPHLEVDYLTLSIFIIIDPLHFQLLPSLDMLNFRYGITNMYNWKYIT